MPSRPKKLSKSIRPALKIEALEQRQLLAGGFTATQGTEFANIVHPNGNTYDQVLMKTAAITVDPDDGQIVRVSFLDPSGDIVQAEFSGAGTLSISLDGATGPADSTKYNQPGIQYMSGLATFTIQGSDASTHFSAFTVGSLTAHGGKDNVLFSTGLTGGNNVADVQRLTIVANPVNPNGSTFGGIRMGNAVFGGSSGVVGITAANVQIQDVVRIGNIIATGSGTPTLVFGEFSQFGAIDVQGGGLLSTNGKSINNTGSYAFGVNLVSGTNSAGVVDAAETATTTILFTGANPFTAINNTFTLTTGVDLIPGLVGSSGNPNTNGDDVINGTLHGTTPALATFTNLDSLNAGTGNDTFNIIDLDPLGSTVPAGATVAGVEAVTARGVGPININSSSWIGVTSLSVIQATAATVVAPSTTAISVSGVPGAVLVNGGSTVNVATLGLVTGASGTVSIGATTAPGGAVTVTTTGVASTDLTGPATFGTITVNGGTTVSVTEVVPNTGASTDVSNFLVTQGAVTVNGNDSTTAVTVTQQGPNIGARNYAAATVGVKEVAEVTFAAVPVSTAVTVDGLTFTTNAATALTAEQAAAAFANLAAGATQGPASSSSGTYTGALSTAFTSSGVSGTKVTFTAASTSADPTNVAATNASAVTTVPGVVAVDSTSGRVGIASGAVTINDGGTAPDSIASVTLVGFGNSAINSDALTTLSLSKSNEDVAITNTTATTLGLTVDAFGVGGTSANSGRITNAPTYTTINLTATGTNSFVELTAGAATTLTVSGSRVADLTASTMGALATVTVSGDAGLTLPTAAGSLTAVTTSTTGTTTIMISPGLATYTGGAGVDVVSLTGAAPTKAISLGAGNDTLTLGSGTVPVLIFDGGDGSDILSGTATILAAASPAAGLFDAQITGFEKVGVTALVTGEAGTVDLAGLDDINFVTQAGGVAAIVGVTAVAAVAEVVTVDFTGFVPADGETLTFNGVTYTDLVDAAAPTLTAFLDAVAATAHPNWNGARVGDTVVFTSDPAESRTNLTAGSFTGTASDNIVTVVTNTEGVTAVTGVTAVPAAGALTIINMPNAGTLEITGTANQATVVTMKDATGTADSLNLIISNSGNVSAGTVTAAGVETMNYTATDTNTTITTQTLTLAANDLTSLTITGTSHVNLALAGATDSLANLDGSAMTGKLTNVGNLAVAQTTKGGSAADTLTASFTGSTLVGNGGDDTLTVAAGANLVTVTGGAGLDSFVISGAASNVNAYSTIMDPTAGDKIKLVNTGATETFAAAQISLDPTTAVFQDYANTAIANTNAGAVSWFQFGGNTYIVENVSDTFPSFQNGVDVIVKLNGLVNLANASFSASSQTLMIV